MANLHQIVTAFLQFITNADLGVMIVSSVQTNRDRSN